MGKNLIQQARGKGSPRYRSPSFKYKGRAQHRRIADNTLNGEVIDLIHCAGHSGPLARVKYENGEEVLTLAPEGIRCGESVVSGKNVEANIGNTATLKDIPKESLIFNIEAVPGDGGKFVRASGTFARILAKVKGGVVVQLPSKKQKTFHPNCRATIGVVAGGGRLEKPILKAGNMFYKMKAKRKLWPVVSGSAQNAVDHPFGNSRTQRKSKARPSPRNAPPGRKVGMIRPRRSGRKTR